MESKEGMKDDDFVYCGEQDLIDAANKEAMRVLIIGKPRSGKTSLARSLAVKMDLFHINIENWILALLDKIKNYEAPEVEEGEEPPKWLSDLEEAINKQLKEGKGPSDEQIIEIIKIQINSPLARTKGYILDLPFYPKM